MVEEGGRREGGREGLGEERTEDEVSEELHTVWNLPWMYDGPLGDISAHAITQDCRS